RGPRRARRRASARDLTCFGTCCRTCAGRARGEREASWYESTAHFLRARVLRAQRPSRGARPHYTTAGIEPLAWRASRIGTERWPDRPDGEPSRFVRSDLKVAARRRVGQPGAEPDDALDQAHRPSHDGERRGQQDLRLYAGAPIL